ncbi:hypothetical protein JDS91_27100 [Bacillus cereus]|uniref:hypothetical protein n=1 Tax=Bacillus cereus TaxID=1396 RepID=UPI0018F350CF|nr:hypothetical protein [Bacillus cereus]
MNIIHFEQARKRKMEEQKMTTKLPIVERIYEVDVEIKFDVSGKKEVSKTMLDHEKKESD